MATVLIISSQVARGYVGGSASRVALEALGHQAWLVPTVLLSNHPAHRNAARCEILPEQIRAFMLALDENGWLYDIDAVLTGYMPTAGHVAEAVNAVGMVQAERNDVRIICDPILGDDPDGLYIDEEAAAAIRDRLLPLAEIITPNRFELEWLTDKPVKSLPQALKAGRGLAGKHDAVVLASSIPGDHAGAVHDLIVFSDAAFRIEHYRRDGVPHGVGDLLTALHTGHLLNGYPPQVAFARAAGGVQTVLDTHRSADDPPLPQLRRHWADAKPLKSEPYYV